MDIIHADAERHEIGFIQDFTKFDAEISQTPTLDRNQFVLTMDEDDYLESGITDGAFAVSYTHLDVYKRQGYDENLQAVSYEFSIAIMEPV